MSLRARLQRARTPPEDSVTLRVVVSLVVMVSVLAVVAQGVVDSLTAVGAIVLPPIGFAFSHAQRDKRNRGAKLVLAVALLAAFASFLQNVQLASSVDDARASLASLFLWVQVLHTFDVPRRRDLAFSVVASVILMAEAASLSLDTTFGLFLVPWVILTGAWLVLSSAPRVDQIDPAVVLRPAGPPRSRLAPIRSLSTAGLVTVVATAAVFMATPRLQGAVVVTPPFSLQNSAPVPGFSGQVLNPGISRPPDGSAPGFTPTAYPGFGGSMDLRSRGRLSDAIVMRVRSSQAALWRGEVYDSFDGTRWTALDQNVETAVSLGDVGGYAIPGAESPSLAPARRLVQTFYVESQEPNVVFAAARAQQVYFPSGGLRVDRYGSIRSPILLDPGLIYSVISDVPSTSPELLRSVPARWGREALARYTQLPASTTPRVRRLAHEITAAGETTYDKVISVQRWLRSETEYNLDIPADPPGADPIDTFLFERRQGFCEHIASAMAVLLRSVGIPTRLVTGFGQGERNTLTGYYEVRERDAHAWIEVLYPGIGWVQYDPTFGVPSSAPSLGSRFIGGDVLRAAAGFLARISPEPLKAAARTIGASAAGVAGWVVDHWMIAVALTAAIAAGLALRRRRRRTAARGSPPTGAAAAFWTLGEVFGGRGRPRGEHETPEEYLRRLGRRGDLPSDSRPDAELVVHVFERDRFAPGGATDDDVDASLAAANRVRERVGSPPDAASA